MENVRTLDDIALDIATKFLAQMNPSNWDGVGEVPPDFDQRVWSDESVLPHERLDISFEYDNEEGWCTVCELVGKDDNLMQEILTSWGVNDPRFLADNIAVMLGWHREEVIPLG